ncbi:hypothetical protein [Ancylobacter sp. IITR112]|uniref:hypothetical protein n=1 Tax=Ancylobacter sp. IITR112 TaxID=3138073 RepID=UPI00352AD215
MPPNPPLDPSALRPSPRIHAASRLDSSYLAYAKSIAHADSDPQLRLAVCRQFVRSGMMGEAVAMLSTLMDVRDLRGSVAEIMGELRALRRMRTDDATFAPDTEAKDKAAKDRGYWVVPAPSDTTLIAFAGQAQMLGLSIYFMHSLLGRLNANLIYLFDWSNSYYFGGVSGLGGDVETTVARLRDLCAQFGSRRVLCLGQSAGGYGALHYGTKLRADGILTFSPIILPVMAEDGRARIARRIGRALTVAETDLRHAIASAAHTAHIEIVYGTENVADVASARHLADLPNVVERPLSGVDSHGTIQVAVASNRFVPLLEAFVRSVGPGSWGERHQRAISDSQ